MEPGNVYTHHNTVFGYWQTNFAEVTNCSASTKSSVTAHLYNLVFSRGRGEMIRKVVEEVWCENEY